MSLPLRKDEPRTNVRAKRDRRRHFRVPLRLSGRFLHADADHTFLTKDISCGSANLEAVAVPPIGTTIVAVDGRGCLAGSAWQSVVGHPDRNNQPTVR